jgi:hypothetical protein
MDNESRDNEASQSEPQAPLLPATRDDDGSDAPPPPVSTNRGPMDQTSPDVATGSTPLTRHDD